MILILIQKCYISTEESEADSEAEEVKGGSSDEEFDPRKAKQREYFHIRNISLWPIVSKLLCYAGQIEVTDI